MDFVDADTRADALSAIALVEKLGGSQSVWAQRADGSPCIDRRVVWNRLCLVE